MVYNLNKKSDANHEKKPVVVVLGVHRSGTSLSARILNGLGIRFGDKLIPGRSDNPAGFFEHQAILEQTRALDNKLKVAPFQNGGIVPCQAFWWKEPGIEKEKAALKQILKKEIAVREGVFGFKDPRSLYYLPLWQEIFSELNLSPRYILALRNINDVVASMMKRGISRSKAEIIFVWQLSAGLRCISQDIDAVIHYEEWFTDAKIQAEKLIKELNIFKMLKEVDVQAVLSDVIQPELRHHSTLKKHEDTFESSMSVKFYDLVCQYARGEILWEAIREKAETISEMPGLCEPYVQEIQQLPVKLQDELDSLKKKVKDLSSKTQLLQTGNKHSVCSQKDKKFKHRVIEPYEIKFPKLNTIKLSAKYVGRSLKICIATEDIIGPVLNGGIGTTYTNMAFLLADAGHDITILYLSGEHCEQGTSDEWVKYYRDRGVKFLPLPLLENIISPAQRWIQPMYSLYQYLKKERYDMVHVSEWHGSGYLSLMAKKQGLAFKNTLFCVKASSPWLWSRENQLRGFENTTEFAKMFAERRSIELADLVISGSAYLLRWMLDHGYFLPPLCTFVHPNVVKPVEIAKESSHKRPEQGTRVNITELVFFGRLEQRKGLDIFCKAINQLFANRVELPKITFMGKFGAKISTHMHMTVEEFIHEQAKDWPVKWQVINNYNQSQAITYLHGEGRLAVMPSVIENSPVTVYETTYFSIPFITTRVGGIAELISKEHRDAVLTRPFPTPLANKIKEAVTKGGFVAASSFDNNKNLGQWLDFHSKMSMIIDHEQWPPESIDRKTDMPVNFKSEEVPWTTVCLVLRNNVKHIKSILSILNKAKENFEVIVLCDASSNDMTKTWFRYSQSKNDYLKYNFKVHFLMRSVRSFGMAKNAIAEQASGIYLLFIDDDTLPRQETIKILSSVAAIRDADVLLPIYEYSFKREKKSKQKGKKQVVFLSGDPGFTFCDPTWLSPIIYVKKQTFIELGGFTTSLDVPSPDQEFIAKAVFADKLVETVPEPLAVSIKDYDENCKDYTNKKSVLNPLQNNHEEMLFYQPPVMNAVSYLQYTCKQLGLQRDMWKKQGEQLKIEPDKIKCELDKLSNQSVAPKDRDSDHDKKQLTLLWNSKNLLKNCFKWCASRFAKPVSYFFQFVRRILK